MRLEVGTFPVRDVEVGNRMAWHDGILEIDTNELLALVVQDPIENAKVEVVKPGESALVLPGVWHRFWTDTGAVIEEVSTTHFHNDSVYKDKAIQDLSREDRKTVVDHWGRYQMQGAE